MKTLTDLNLLLKLPQETIQENKSIIIDLLLCIQNEIPFTQWLEDVYEAQEDTNPYSYPPEQLETFLSQLENL